MTNAAPPSSPQQAFLAAMALVSADIEFKFTVTDSSDSGRKMLQTNRTGCLDATNNCLFTPYAVSLGLQQDIFTDTTTGWFSMLPGENLDGLCVSGTGQPAIFVYAKDLLEGGSLCPPTETDVVPPGFTDSKKFCLNGQEPHVVARTLGLYTDEETGASASTCTGLGSCYGEVTFYELTLPDSWSLPCTNG
eukprot:evm.model.scf_1205.1 EVM.evm.TU.scf_1205.1   scf_1205:41904-42663(+)